MNLDSLTQLSLKTAKAVQELELGGMSLCWIVNMTICKREIHFANE